MDIKLVYVNDDWQRLYINDKLVYETHFISAYNLMQELAKLKLANVSEESIIEED